MNALKAYLVQEFGLHADADDAAVRKQAAESLVSGALSHDKYLELITPQAAQPNPLDKLADALANRLGLTGAAHSAASPLASSAKAQGAASTADSPLHPEKLFAAAAGSRLTGQPRVKRASESYGATKSRKVYPQQFGD